MKDEENGAEAQDWVLKKDLAFKIPALEWHGLWCMFFNRKS